VVFFEKEEEIPEPCGFTEVLAIMDMTEQDQLNLFHSLYETHIDPAFAKATNIRQFMEEECIIVFTNFKQNWDGIQEFTSKTGTAFKQTRACRIYRVLPARLKPPPSILDVAKKEFDRLRTYFLIPSTSPVASIITVASKATPSTSRQITTLVQMCA